MPQRAKSNLTTVVFALTATLVAVTLGTFSAPGLAAGTVQVKFIESDRFSDIGVSAVERDQALQTLGDHLRQLGAGLPEGQTLSIDVLDVDLAGTMGAQRPNTVRVMRGTGDWPRVRLRWSLMAGGNTLRSGEEQLSDMNYLTKGRTSEALAGDFSYEKRLLDRWFADTFGASR